MSDAVHAEKEDLLSYGAILVPKLEYICICI